jgi:hypothetical protein
VTGIPAGGFNYSNIFETDKNLGERNLMKQVGCGRNHPGIDITEPGCSVILILMVS